MSKSSPFGTLEGPKMPYIGYKMHFTTSYHPDGVFWTTSGHFGPSDNVFRGQNADFGTIGGPTRLDLLIK